MRAQRLRLAALWRFSCDAGECRPPRGGATAGAHVRMRRMGELQLVADLVLAVLAAFVGGVIAQRLGQPVILGYLLAGVIIGPFTPGPQADVHSIQVLAEIGVAFLMFALGAEF